MTETTADASADLTAIRKKNAAVIALRSDWAIKDAAAKASKKLLESAQDDLSRFIDGLNRHYPLFDQAQPSDAAPAAETTAQASDDPDAWKAIPLQHLHAYGLSDKLLAALAEEGLLTFGDLADWAAEKPLTDLRGVGPTKAEAIGAAVEAYWADHPRPATEATEATEPVREWRARPIADLAIEPNVAAALMDAGVSTLGDLPELLASFTDESLAARWELAIEDAARIRDSFDALANAADPPPTEEPPAKPRRRKAEAEANAEAAA